MDSMPKPPAGLTGEQIDTLSAGQYLDRLVAEACGMRLDHNGLIVPQLTDCNEIQFSPQRHSFRPSSDWNDAMLAASHSNLFELETVPADPNIPGRHSNAQFQAFLTRDCGYWTVHLYCYFAGYATGIMNRAIEHQSVRLLAEDKSGPVAVCKAILKNKRAV